MNTLLEHIDTFASIPLATIVALYLYMSQNRFKQIIERDQENFDEVLKGYQKTIEKLIDKLKK